MLYLALLLLLLALAGAVLHPFGLLLRSLPVEGPVVSVVHAASSFLAHLLLWSLLTGLAFALVLVFNGRRPARRCLQGSDWGLQRMRLPWADAGLPQVVVAMTAYNHAGSIVQAVQEFLQQPGVLEVIVVDNNSTDGTAELAAAAGARVVREEQQGYGYTCIRGLKEALAVPGANVIVLVEGDGTFSARDLAKFRAYLEHADMVIGTRTVPGLVERGSQMDIFFTWGNIFIGTLLRLRFWDAHFLGKARFTDVGCTYRAIRREALACILPHLQVGGNHFSPHMLLVALAQGLGVIEIPITFWRRVGQSKGASQSLWKGLQVGLVMIWHILTYRPRWGAAAVRFPLPAPAEQERKA